VEKNSKAAKIRVLLAEGMSVADIAKKLKYKVPYVQQVRWHWKKAAGKKPKAKKDHGRVGDMIKPTKLIAAAKDMDEVMKLLEKNTEEFNKALDVPYEKPESKKDMVNSPSHYTVGGIETIDFIEAKQLNYNLGNVVKYITRADHKGKRGQDLNKALWYLTREIENTEGEF
jgi:hypothetical protein